MDSEKRRRFNNQLGVSREWGSLNLYIGILGIHEPSFPTKGQLDNQLGVLFKTWYINSVEAPKSTCGIL